MNKFKSLTEKNQALSKLRKEQEALEMQLANLKKLIFQTQNTPLQMAATQATLDEIKALIEKNKAPVISFDTIIKDLAEYTEGVSFDSSGTYSINFDKKDFMVAYEEDGKYWFCYEILKRRTIWKIEV